MNPQTTQQPGLPAAPVQLTPTAAPTPAAMGTANPAAPATTPIAANNHRALAIISILFTLVFGIVALHYSWQVDAAAKEGDAARAAHMAKRTVIWATVSIVIGCLAVILQIVGALANPTH